MGFTDTRVSALLSFLPVFYLVISRYCIATDTITSSRSITDGETLISAGGIMELGFFSPGNSSNRYVGMWYKKIPIRKVVWVLNRMNPLNDFSGVLAIGNDGNLILLDEKENAIWSTKASSLSNNSVAVLQDSGNLVLKENSSDGRILWQSFDYPSDTLLETMKIGMNFKTGEKRNLTSWKSKDDPSPGIFALVGDDRKPPQFFVMNGSVPYWRTGQWNGRSFIGVPEMSINYLVGVNLIMDEEEGTLYLTFSLPDSYTAVLNLQSSGELMQADWNEDKKEWFEWFTIKSQCDVYGTCGPFGSCNRLESPICSCMRGFEPRFHQEWRKGNWTGGCVRSTKLECQENSTSPVEGKGDKFLELGGMKLPDFADYLAVGDVRECQDRCLKNCSCLAYGYISGPGCMVWGVDLIDVQKFPAGGEQLYLRLASSEIGERKQTSRSIIILIIIFGLVSLGALGYILYRCKANQSGKRKKVRPLFDLASKAEPSRDSPLANIFIHGMKQEQSTELPLFDFSTIITATNNFSVTNQLGEGGYGPVYKGKLLNEQEIAVKRLSKSSGQGIEEFKNEVVLISRLQHRNLVKLLGCCIEGEEKMLLYEYMPNKSLDMFLFDPSKQAQLDWAKRFNIIEGIARGLLYLHRDSRLRVIHRDLKVSNILLDKDMNPKISDFGMARIFGGEQSVANTKKVAGTFGYMSPEYALGGIFSEKSDVFSFGVLLLEIVAGKRNTSFHHQEKSLNLLGYAWRLWNEGKGLELMDGALVNSCSPLEVMRCIHVGLLCVQENATDRPTMPAVVLMLGCETNRQHPKQPGFTLECSLESDLPPDNDKCSINNVTVTKVQGR